MERSNILIIGGAGFIGSHLAEILVKQKHNIVVIDNLYLGDEKNLECIKKEIKFLKHDYTDEKFLEQVVSDNKIEYIFHFGGLSSAPMFDENEIEGIYTGIVGFTTLLKVAAKFNVKRVLYASTSSLYGDLEIQEESVGVTPPSFYALTKYTMEHLARLFYENYGLESIGFRFFSVYGKNEKHKKQYANLVSQFLWAIQDNKETVFYGDGTQTRDFTYVIDICDALIKGMTSSSDYAKGNIYNIGTTETYTLLEMVEILEEITGKKANKKFISNPIKNYVQHTKADIKKIEKDLMFHPSYTLKQGIIDILK